MPNLKRPSVRRLPGDFDSLVRLHPPRAIVDEVGYDNTQEMIDALTSLPAPTRGQAEYLETLTILFAAYEAEHQAIDVSDLSPLDMLKFLIAEHDMNASDLGRLLGDRALGMRILNGKRQLSKAHIRTLSDHFHVRADLFL